MRAPLYSQQADEILSREFIENPHPVFARLRAEAPISRVGDTGVHLVATWDLVQGILFYSFQIYSDFYGYSTIAVGSALIMGIRIMDNFKTPYLAKNIAEFWQRWHISLSTWFRDYLYYPMGGNRVKKFRWMINIAVVFTVSGIWHGANWTFLIWGGFFGLIYVTEKVINTRFNLEKYYSAYSIGHILLALKTFAMVTILWIFKYLYLNTGTSSVLSVPIYVWVFLILFIISDIILYNKRFDSWVNKFVLAGRWGVYAFLIFSIIVFAGVENFPFIYFQF